MTISHYGPGSYNNPRRLVLATPAAQREIRKLHGANDQKD